MSRLKMVSPEQASGEVKETLDAIGQKFGMVPNIFKIMANSPAALKGAMGLFSGLNEGKLPGELRERICLAVAQHNKCHY